MLDPDNPLDDRYYRIRYDGGEFIIDEYFDESMGQMISVMSSALVVNGYVLTNLKTSANGNPGELGVRHQTTNAEYEIIIRRTN